MTKLRSCFVAVGAAIAIVILTLTVMSLIVSAGDWMMAQPWWPSPH